MARMTFVDSLNKIQGNQGINNLRSPGESANDAIDRAKMEDFKAKLEAAMKKRDDEGLRNVSQEFEAYFVGVLLKQMRKTVVDGGLIQKSEARKQFESMLDDEYAKKISGDGGIGLGDAIYEALKIAYY